MASLVGKLYSDVLSSYQSKICVFLILKKIKWLKRTFDSEARLFIH